ncbi:HPr family phosphocarrier protein [Psychrobacillus psychrodurans]|uniref:Phosphocarrier protein HPr n=1 Tax=Psychrobacillus psychrodurans TaxID=126157 RepID=A0A9X3RAB6_9BACI|nr:HPr family phosphocarrier protein [Psychrobacillus psychrodurans]MCZ8533866.1 HPr family phosphocarrier protein [Psychrobacillus psychrodurans]
MEKTFKITTPEGLHARPSTLLVSAATAFTSNVLLSYNDKSVNLKSIMGVMAQGIAPGSVVTISAEGMDAEETILKLTEIIISNGLGVEF